MLYKVVDNITSERGFKLQRGKCSLLKGFRPSMKTALLKKGRVVEWSTPPLSVLPGWGRRAAVLEEYGIGTISRLVSADLVQLSRVSGIDKNVLERVVEDALNLLDIEMEEGNA